jgi:hypothetical protein
MYNFMRLRGDSPGIDSQSVYDVVRVSTMRARLTCWCGGRRSMPVLGVRASGAWRNAHDWAEVRSGCRVGGALA